MNDVAFIDTSVLCNVVPVPGRDQQRADVIKEMKAMLEAGVQFVLPITAVVETGNFIAQIADGRVRRETAVKFTEILQLVCDSKAPWILHDFRWDKTFLEELIDGAETGMSYLEHAMSQVGAGDLCILTERVLYTRRTRIAATVWTLDHGLGAHLS